MSDAERLETGNHRWAIAPYFLVEDVVRSASYYRDKLGFVYDQFWGDPAAFCMVRRSGIVIMLSQLAAPGAVRPNRIVDPSGDAWDAYIWVDDADALYAEFKFAGVRIVRSICNQDYGCRDFEVEDCDGYRLCFGADLEARDTTRVTSEKGEASAG
jgi:predicted enzyme related to lactoylglutathione lyase